MTFQRCLLRASLEIYLSSLFRVSLEIYLSPLSSPFDFGLSVFVMLRGHLCRFMLVGCLLDVSLALMSSPVVLLSLPWAAFGPLPRSVVLPCRCGHQSR